MSDIHQLHSEQYKLIAHQKTNFTGMHVKYNKGNQTPYLQLE